MQWDYEDSLRDTNQLGALLNYTNANINAELDVLRKVLIYI